MPRRHRPSRRWGCPAKTAYGLHGAAEVRREQHSCAGRILDNLSDPFVPGAHRHNEQTPPVRSKRTGGACVEGDKPSLPRRNAPSGTNEGDLPPTRLIIDGDRVSVPPVRDSFVGDDVHHLACGICPSRRYRVGQFDVYERPTADCPFNPADGHRYAPDGTPVCVHPEKVGLPPGAYRSKNAPLAVELRLPPDPSKVVSYLHDVLYGAAPVLLEDLLSQASEQIRERFPDLDPVTVLRQALS